MAGHDVPDGPPDAQARIVTTRSGFRIRLPGAGDFEAALDRLAAALAGMGGIRGAAVTVDAAGRALDGAQLRSIETLLLERCGAALLQVVEGQRPEPGEARTGAPAGRARGRASRRRTPPPLPETAPPRAPGPNAAPAEPEEAAPDPAPATPASPAAEVAGAASPVPVLARRGVAPPPAAGTAVPTGLPVEMTPTLLVRRTLRSGQRIRFNGNVVVLGDVNPGAEIVASGDIVVMGTLRGVAHAGATGSPESIVAAFRLQPVQLRVDTVIGRAPDGQPPRPDAPEVARLRDGALVIERFLAQGSE